MRSPGCMEETLESKEWLRMKIQPLATLRMSPSAGVRALSAQAASHIAAELASSPLPAALLSPLLQALVSPGPRTVARGGHSASGMLSQSLETMETSLVIRESTTP